MEDESDCDTYDEEELQLLFKEKCKLLVDHQATAKNKYVLHLAGTDEANFNIAIGTSDECCEVFNFSNNQIAKIDTLGEHNGSIVGVRFSPDNSSLLYTAAVKGYIRLWDLRCSDKLVMHFKDTTERKPNFKPLYSFDVSSTNRLLAGGTELSDGDAFILFWDIRSVKLLGGYWESHTNDITQVRFHPENVDLLASGSTDGLINIYDVSQSIEDEALLNSLNTESSVEKFMWCKYKKKECISVITHTSDLQLWRTEDVEPFTHFRREGLGSAMKRKSSTYCYLVEAHSYDFDKIFLLAASNWMNGECLRSLQVENTKLEPLFMLKENNQLVRCSWYNQHYKILVTGGESGKVHLWSVNINR